ncbi:C6 transcription factor [Neofusicoccum parvum]|uniref:C6 transcription factor n=1 Tax=Neofusicoccum parvum TaxID=310453 RepID=A0ACB5RPZ1_9PEZI|nr:C6 transcription factor [Neofusicoccum parvum]
MSEPPRIDPALEFGDQQPDRPDHDFKQRFQGLQDSFYAHGPFYGSYPPQGQNASQPSADSADAALQAIATAAQQDRRASTPSSASVGATDPNAQNNQTKLGPDGKRLRACDHCRALKVRCDPQEENGLISEISPCKRCLKSKKTCVTTAPTKKRTKKADTRVAELEKKVNELTARLGDNPAAPYAYASHPDAPLPEGAHGPADFADSARPEKRRRMNDQEALISNEVRREIMFDEHAEIAAAAHQRVENRPPQSDYSYISYEVDRCLNPEIAERVVCYYLGTNIAMVLRRPMLLRWNQYMDECVSELESSPDALPSDKVLCYHVRLAAIAEDVASQFSMDDPAASANLADKFNEIALRNYDTKLELLRAQRPSNANQTVLKFSESVVGLYTHEVAMHHNQNVDESAEDGRPKTLGPVQTSSLKECVKSCHGVLDNFLSLDFDALYALPLMYCYYENNNNIGGQGIGNYNWDMAGFGDFDFSNMGMGVDLSSLFGGDMGYEQPQQYQHQGQSAHMYPEPSANWNA